MRLRERSNHSALELWGGVECTINRVENNYIDQLELSGHLGRISDFDRFASLGVKALRHGVLWERTAPDGLHTADWAWADASLQKLQELNIRPIVGLLHHGSGPLSTNLLDTAISERLAAYASAVAQRYPWVEDYTPVNEPLTTARFSALYGHWYPHAQDDYSFARALLNQCRAIVLCMREIRKINSSARLIQTEDLGKVFSTPQLAYQAEFENVRRWCTFDILSGQLDRNHRMWQHFTFLGIDEAELQWFLENPCPPDVIGINHYLSGERYLDHNLERYPDYLHGKNGKDRYADLLATRVLRHGATGPYALLSEAWNRYHIPLAITECHNGCTREEQLRWFLEVWRSAERCREDGMEVLAVTAWSLLGAFDWDHLVTRKRGNYEPGVFDVRFGKPRPTGIARLARQLAAGETPRDPLLQVPGWWRRAERFVYGFAVDESGEAYPAGNPCDEELQGARPVIITGASGTLGQAFARICKARGIPYRLLSRQQMDIADQKSVRKALFTLQPWAIINAAGYVRVDDAENDRARCYRENSEGPFILATECRQRDIQLLTFSSDLVFGERGSRPFIESDPTNPMNYYGVTKADAEQRVLSAMPSALLVRSSAFFGPWDEYNFVAIALRELQAGHRFRAAADVTVSPTYVPDLVNLCLDLLIDDDDEGGIWHLANPGAISWFELAKQAAILAGISTDTLEAGSQLDLRRAAKTPSYSVLRSERAVLLPSLDISLRRYIDDCEISWATADPEKLLATG